MQVSVTFRHLETDEGIKDYVKGKIDRLRKHLENPTEIHIVLTAEKFRHFAEVTILGEGLTLNSEGKDRDLYAAIDQMVDKMDRQIRNRKGKEKWKRGNSISSEISSATEETTPQGDEEAGVSASIIRKRIPAKPMSLEEAVAQLQLTSEEFLFFINSDSNQMNVLRRSSEGYEWVEPSSE